MTINDSFYGNFEITDLLLLDLLNSNAVQRLKHIHQAGISSMLGILEPMTRYQHSVGTMLLVKKLGAGHKEQAAALLHDLSHTAFSHVVDFVFGKHGEHGYHDVKKLDFIQNTQIPMIAKRHKLDWQELVDEDRYPLLEQSAPLFCADRVDYTLRSITDMKLASNSDCQSFLDSLIVYEKRIVSNSQAAAQWFAEIYLRASETSWLSVREIGLYELTARAIKVALEEKIITEKELWLTDQELWDKLHESKNLRLQKALEPITAKSEFVIDHKNPDFVLSPKVRFIDPEVLIDNEVKTLSTIDKNFAQRLDEYLSKYRKPMMIRYLKTKS